MRLTEVYEITKLIEWLDDSLLYGKGPVELHVTPRGWEFRQEGAEPHLVEPDGTHESQREILFHFEGTVLPEDIDTEDSGMAKIARVDQDPAHPLFVRVQSYDDAGQHELFTRFANAATVVVSVQIVED